MRAKGKERGKTGVRKKKERRGKEGDCFGQMRGTVGWEEKI